MKNQKIPLWFYKQDNLYDRASFIKEYINPNLTIEEIIKTLIRSKGKSMRIKSISKRDPIITVDIEVNNTHTYQLSNGAVSHNTVSQKKNTSSGIHPRYSDYYIRRVRVNSKDPICDLLVSKGIPHNPEVGQTWDYNNTLVFDFPMKSPRGAIKRDDMDAIEQLEYWKMFNECWCDGNPSATIYVKEDEWVEVGAWIYKNWNQVCGLSFLPYDGSVYQLAPYEEIDKDKYYELCKLYNKVDIDFDRDLPIFEKEDTTQGSKELACAGGVCEFL